MTFAFKLSGALFVRYRRDIAFSETRLQELELLQRTASEKVKAAEERLGQVKEQKEAVEESVRDAKSEMQALKAAMGVCSGDVGPRDMAEKRPDASGRWEEEAEEAERQGALDGSCGS